jgi:AmmeMemoRadiSam system protein B
MESWETPYGLVRVDQALARALISKGTISENNELFDNDEQIESQLPFLQFVFKSNKEALKILPILVSHDVQMKKLAVDIKEVLLELGKKAVVIIPTNFTYYGLNIITYLSHRSQTRKFTSLTKGDRLDK